MIVTPIFFNETGKPRNRELYSAVLGYLEGEFGEEVPDVKKMGRAWACLEVSEGGESFKVVGICGGGYSLDVPLFHSHSPRAFMAMFKRLHDWAEDLGAKNAFVYVDPKNYRAVGPYLKQLKAQPGHRWKVRVGRLKE